MEQIALDQHRFGSSSFVHCQLHLNQPVVSQMLLDDQGLRENVRQGVKQFQFQFQFPPFQVLFPVARRGEGDVIRVGSPPGCPQH